MLPASGGFLLRVSTLPESRPVLDRATSVGFIGAGKLGSSLAKVMAERDYNVILVARRDAKVAADAAAGVVGAEPTTDAQRVATECAIIFVTTSDAAISDVTNRVDWSSVDAVVHCSGATPVSVLMSAFEAGAVIGGWHPMQTFPSSHMRNHFKGVTVAIESESPELFSWLETLAANLGARSFRLNASDRAAYHASAVMACGLVAGLTGLAADMWTTFGMTREDGLNALAPLVTQTGGQIERLGVPGAITGPYVRGDVETVRSHLAVTSAAGVDIGQAYAALALAHLPIANEQGNISSEDYATIEALLRAATRQR